MKRKNALMVFVMYSILTLGVFTPFITFEQAFASDALWGIDKSSPTIYHLSPVDGSVISSATITLASFTVNGGTGLATDPTTGTVWALLKVQESPTRLLVTIVPSTGVATLVGDTGDAFAGIAFLADGTLQGVTGDAGSVNSSLNPETLFTLSKTTGLPTLVCALGNGDDGEEIAFNPSDGLVWHASGYDGGQIFETIDDNVCNVTDVPLSGTIHIEAVGMTYSTAEGLFLVSDFDGDFYSLTNTGVETLRGNSAVAYTGLAFADAGLNDECSTHSHYSFPAFPFTGEVLDPNPSISNCPDGSLTTSIPEFVMNCDPSGLCIIEVPNFVDELDMKDIAIDFTFIDPPSAEIFGPSLGVNVDCFDPVNNFSPIPGVIHDQGVFPQEIEPNVYIFDVWCEPNPDWETITFQLPDDPVLLSVDVWTTSFNDRPVGGTFIPIDTSSLLLAGAASVSMWMIPVVIAGAGIGVFIIKRKN